LGRLTRDKATVIVAHRLSSVLHADEIVVLDVGRIVERGDHASLLAHGGVYARLYALQSRQTSEGVQPSSERNADQTVPA